MRAADGVSLQTSPNTGPPDARPPYGSPTASANLYCDGQIDAALAQVIVPVWQWANARAAGHTALWLMRYSRGGEHLKIRLHTTPELVASIAAELEKAAELFFEQMPPRDPTRTRRINHQIPAIDAEDAVTEPHPDRTLLWTRYRCPPSHMGPEPLSRSPGFAKTYTAALAAATDVVLQRIESAGGQPPSSNSRVSLFATFLLSVAALSGFRGSDTLAHHRDWLLSGSQANAQSALSFMDRRLSAEPETCDVLRRRWQAVARGELIPGFQSFSRALAEHVDLSLSTLGTSTLDGLDSHGDRQQVDGAIARILHNIANLLRVDLSNEIYMCHLLHCASSTSSS